MPKIASTSAAEKKEFRKGLPEESRPKFDELVALVGAPRNDLARGFERHDRQYTDDIREEPVLGWSCLLRRRGE
jgi:hypothetical protein